MRPQVCATIAAIIAALQTNTEVEEIYSCDDHRAINIHTRFDGSVVIGYDGETGAHFTGTLPHIYHYGTGADLDIIAKDDGSVVGFDYDSGTSFYVRVSDKTLVISDGTREDAFRYRS